MRSPLAAPKAHWLHQKPTSCTKRSLAAPEAHWLHQKPTGCTGNPLAAPEAHWLRQKPTGCARNPLAASETQWLNQKPSGCTRNPLAVPELNRLHKGRDSAPIETYLWTLLILHIKKVSVYNLRQKRKFKDKDRGGRGMKSEYMSFPLLFAHKQVSTAHLFLCCQLLAVDSCVRERKKNR